MRKLSIFMTSWNQGFFFPIECCFIIIYPFIFFLSPPAALAPSDLCTYMCLKPGSIELSSTHSSHCSTHIGPQSLKEIGNKRNLGKCKCSRDPNVKLLKLPDIILILKNYRAPIPLNFILFVFCFFVLVRLLDHCQPIREKQQICWMTSWSWHQVEPLLVVHGCRVSFAMRSVNKHEIHDIITGPDKLHPGFWIVTTYCFWSFFLDRSGRV